MKAVHSPLTPSSPAQVQTVHKITPVMLPNQSEPVMVGQKKLEYKWGMNVLGEWKHSVSVFEIVPYSLTHYSLYSVFDIYRERTNENTDTTLNSSKCHLRQ